MAAEALWTLSLLQGAHLLPCTPFHQPSRISQPCTKALVGDGALALHYWCFLLRPGESTSHQCQRLCLRGGIAQQGRCSLAGEALKVSSVCASVMDQKKFRSFAWGCRGLSEWEYLTSRVDEIRMWGEDWAEGRHHGKLLRPQASNSATMASLTLDYKSGTYRYLLHRPNRQRFKQGSGAQFSSHCNFITKEILSIFPPAIHSFTNAIYLQDHQNGKDACCGARRAKFHP